MDDIKTGPILETKVSRDGEISGYCARYGEIDGDGEVFEPFAFRDSLEATKTAGHRLPLLWMHDMRQPIGSWTSFSEVPEGLFGTARINVEVEKGREALSLVRKGDLSGLSVGFTAATRRGPSILRAALMEVSLVSIPCAPKARVKLKDCGSIADLTEALMQGRVARRDVEYLARKGWPGTADDSDLDALAERIARATRRLKGL
jgi:HK97 family phage prohead protease